MFRLLGILSLGHLLFGGRRRRRALRRGILFGALLGYFAGRDFDTGRVKEDIRRAGDSVRGAVRSAKKEFADGFRSGQEERDARREELRAEKARTAPVPAEREGPSTEDLVRDLERDARTAAMAADVPVIDFPEEDGKYNTARKYGYV